MTLGERLLPRSGFLREWVDLYAPMGEAAEAAHLGTALALLSAAVGWRAWIRWGEMSEPCTLNVILEGQSATARKTTTAAAAKRVAAFACDQTDEEPALTCRDMTHTSGRGIYDSVATADREVAKRWAREPPPGHLWVWDEIGPVLGRPGDGKGQDWKGDIRAALMVLTSGSHGGVQLGSTKLLPSRCAVSVLGTMTRAELEERASHGLIHDGFLGRMVLIPFAGRRAYLAEPPAWTPLDTQARDRLVERIRVIVSSDGMGEAFSHFEPRARELRRCWYERRTKEFDDSAAKGGEVDVARVTAHGRLQAIAVKLAVLSAIAAGDPEDDLVAVRVSERDVEWGIWLAEYALSEVVDIASSGAGTVNDRYGRKVVEYLARRNGDGPVSRKRILDDVVIDGLDRAARWRVIEGLAQDSTVEIRKVATGARPRLDVELCE